MKKLIFACPSVNTPSGGVKVIYKIAEELKKLGYNAQVYHPSNLDFECSWFDFNVDFKRDHQINPEDDLLIVPEGWGPLFSRECVEKGIPYIVIVQNGYQLVECERIVDYGDVDFTYKNCECVISVSENTTSLLVEKYPFLAKKIEYIRPFIYEKFDSNSKKEKIITYMPRKLHVHSNMVLYLASFLRQDGWIFREIHNDNEDEVVRKLSTSSIFMSFSYMEGLGLPPIEAAISRNIVVGYTGEGGDEYFEPPLFRNVNSGNFLAFVTKLKEAVKDVGDGMLHDLIVENQIDILKNRYSYAEFSDCVKKVFNRYSSNV